MTLASTIPATCRAFRHVLMCSATIRIAAFLFLSARHWRAGAVFDDARVSRAPILCVVESWGCGRCAACLPRRSLGEGGTPGYVVAAPLALKRCGIGDAGLTTDKIRNRRH